MELRDRTLVILGGSGLVGHAVARRLLAAGPKRLVLVALFEDEVRATARALDGERGATVIDVEWGNVFLPATVAQLDRAAVDGELVPVGIDRLTDRRDATIHTHATGANQILGFAPGRHARARQDSLYPECLALPAFGTSATPLLFDHG